MKYVSSTIPFHFSFIFEWVWMININKATLQPETTTVNDDSVCSICFEKFETPGYLLCNHSFCHNCFLFLKLSVSASLWSLVWDSITRFVMNTSRVTETFDGRNVFIKLQKLTDQADEIHCKPCLRENDKEKATNYLSCKEYL